MNSLAAFSALVTSASTLYSLLAAWAGARFRHQRRDLAGERGDHPPVSILKPLKGTDPGMYESLRSHCVQDYPDYEILFGLRDAADPALAVVRRLMEEFSKPPIRLVLEGKQLGANGKVSSLAAMATLASHEYLLVNDSDIRIEPDFLTTVVAELRAPGTGLVTCLYRGVPAGTIGSQLEALGINTDFAAGVLAARELEGRVRFGLGAGLAFRRSDLEAVGGFESLADYLGDDYELGRRIAQRGRVELSQSVVETYLPAYNFRAFLSHQLRWARTIRAARPGGYLGLLLTFTLPWAILSVILSAGAAWAWALFALAISARAAMAVTTATVVVQEKQSLASFCLLPVRDVVALAVWVAGCFGRRIVWRGEPFRLVRGRLERIRE